MGNRKTLERRKARPMAFRLGHPLFVNVSETMAATFLCASSLVVILASQLTPMLVSYGPTFLLICAFGAWFVGNRFAVILGIFIVIVQTLDGQLVSLQAANLTGIIDLLFQLGSAFTVVLMLGVARVALELEWRFARLDPLTGALNRKAFFEALEERARQAQMAVLIFADLNGLKKLNDSHGHESGDETLKRFAARVRRAIRKEDVFARIGGDEFAIFLNVRDFSAAKLVAERLNNVVNLGPERSEEDLTCSLGVLVLPEGTHQIDAELKEADLLMYSAKRQRSGSAMAISQSHSSFEILTSPSPASPADLSVKSGWPSRRVVRKDHNSGLFALVGN